MAKLWQDVRFALRTLAKAPGFTAVAVFTIALGIGANAAIFTVVNAVLLRPLAFRDPAKIVLVEERNSFGVITTSYENYRDWRDQSRSFTSMEASCPTAMTLTGWGDPQRLFGRFTTAGFFPLLGVEPVVGRNFAREEDTPSGAPVVMLSYALWQRLGAGRDLVGKSLVLNTKPYIVIGVVPPGFEFLSAADFYVAFEPWAKTLPDDRDWHPGIMPVARLKPGVKIEQARAEMLGITARLEKQYPDYNTGTSSDVVPLQAQVVEGVRPALLVLLSAVGFILLIACANMANLQLARGASRAREVAIRTALGASRRRIIGQLLTESMLISLAGGALGLFIAYLSLDALLHLSAGVLPDVNGIHIDRWVLAYAAAASILTGVLFGLMPAWRTAQLDLRDALNEGGRGASGGAASRKLRSSLVVAEIATAMLLLVGAGLLLRSLERMQAASAGFAPDHLLVADLPLSPNAYPKSEQRFHFFDTVLEKARALPGVTSAGAASFLPMSGSGSLLLFNIYGHPPKNAHEYIVTGYRTVTDGYFETLKVPLIEGRTFTRADDAKAPAVVVVNASFAKQFFPRESPLGKRIQVGGTPDKDVPWLEIVGVVGDLSRGMGADPKAEMFLPYQQADGVLPVFVMSLVLRTGTEPTAEASALRAALASVDKDQPLVRVRTMEDNLSATAAQPRFRTWLLSLFALLALLLSTIGIYGVMSYSVSQRSHEIGIRIALGAQQAQVFKLVTGEGLKLALLGILIGFAATLALTRLLRSFLYEVSPLDPITYAIVAGLLIGVSVFASYMPAQRATAVDPLVALRHE
jgi:putative ABC transport system permease protein